MNRVREIHSTDINKDIYSHIKNTVPTKLTCTSSQGCPIHCHQRTRWRLNVQIKQDLTGISIRHLAWILTDSSLIQESDLAMSSSGKMAADKNTEYKPLSTVKQPQCTNSQRIHKRVHVQHIHETFPTKS